jgi:hypothetical protein
MPANIQTTQKYRRLTILHHIEPDGTLWATAGRTILRQRSGQQDWEPVARFPFAAPRDYFAFSRITTRAMRADKCNLYVNQHGGILGIRAGTAYAIQPNQPPQPLFNIQGDAVLHGSLCADRQGNIYFGEYIMNPARGPVHIWRVAADLSSGEPVYTFPAGSIRHIHGVYPDPYQPDTFWIPTGDFEDECYLYRTSDNFQTMERFGDGTQTWRAVRLFFTAEHICWLTDSNLAQNHACRMRRADGELEIGQTIDASSWYGAKTKDGLYVAFTTVEPGPGIHTDHSTILISHDAFHWQPALTFKKDFWRPMKVFKYGVISCPSGLMSNQAFYISGEGLVDLDGRSLQLKIEVS